MTTSSARLPRIHLQPGGDRRIARGYPWAYSNEVRMDGDAKALPAGQLVTLHRVDGKPLGVGTFNPHALIAVRLVDRDAGATVDRESIAARLRRALGLRERLFDRPFYRLVHAEADGLPGLVVDRYGPLSVVQVNTAGCERLIPEILAALDDVISPETVVLRNDSRARALEGLPSETRIVTGSVAEPIAVIEDGLQFLVDPVAGQKTGWFYDQHANRRFVARLATSGTVLDVYCHSGGFAIGAAAAGAADVLAVDSSEPALALAGASAQANGVAGTCTFQRAEAFATLESLGTDGRRFRLVVADPPAFVKSRKDLSSGLRGYRKMSRLAAALVEPEGFLFVASCSHNVTAPMFAEEVASGLQRAGRTGRILRAAGAGPDHPVHPMLPESAYLKTLTLQLD